MTMKPNSPPVETARNKLADTMNLAAWIRRSSRDNNLNRFCVEPFSGLDITHSGRVYMCCADWRPVPVGNMLETPLMDIWMGKPASDLRSSILDQSFRFCRATCPLLENPRGPVRIGSAPPALPSLDRLNRLTLSYDPTCNLKCPSCRTAHLGSSENTELIHRMVIQSGILQRTNLLYIAGDGDPIASPLYWSLLRSLDPLPLNPKLAVRLHTNGLLLTPERWAELGETSRRVINICVSVDAACEDTYRINRGGSWRLLQDNLAFISSLPGISLEMNFVVQANNFREMTDFVRLAFGYSAKVIFFAGLRNWDAPKRPGGAVFLGPDHLNRAVHLPSHPQHRQLLEILQDPIFKDPRILLADYLA